MGEGLESQVAVNTDNIAELRRESERTRERLHDLEIDRPTLRLLVTQVRELTASVPQLARSAARETLDEYLRRRHANVLANLKVYAAVLSAGAALGALVAMVIALVLR